MISLYRGMCVLYCTKENPKTTGIAFKKGYFERGGHIGVTTMLNNTSAQNVLKVSDNSRFFITTETVIAISHKDLKQQYLIKSIKYLTYKNFQEFYEKIKNEQWLEYYE